MCDHETPAFFDERRPVARVDHRCFECRRTIAPGAVYARIVGQWNGEFESFAICLRCRRVAAALAKEDGECGPGFGELRWELHERNRSRRHVTRNVTSRQKTAPKSGDAESKDEAP